MSVSLMSAGGAVLDTTTAEAWDIKSGETAYNGDGELVIGTMVDQGAKTASLAPGDSYTIPAGYHNGNGKVTAKRSYTTVFLGQQTAYWTDFTYDVKSNYGSIYDKLSRSNFYTVPYAWSGNCIEQAASGSGDCSDYVSYNANNGMLTVRPQSYGRGGVFISNVLFKVYMIY